MEASTKRRAPEVVDLCGDDRPAGPAPSKGGGDATTGAFRGQIPDASPVAPEPAKARGTVTTVMFTKGVLDPEALAAFAAICQQANCVGTDCKGLSAGIASTLPYGCPYKTRQRMPLPGKGGKLFAAPNSRPSPGTLQWGFPTTNEKLPIVINFFSQWEMGGPEKYNRVPPPDGLRDSASQRERWFQACLDELAGCQDLPASVAFPENIGCGLGGGYWPTYRRMIERFAERRPETSVYVVQLGDASIATGSTMFKRFRRN